LSAAIAAAVAASRTAWRAASDVARASDAPCRTPSGGEGNGDTGSGAEEEELGLGRTPDRPDRGGL